MKSLYDYPAAVKADLVKKRMKQEDLAKRMKMDPTVLSRKMNSPHRFRLDEIFLIQTILGWDTLEG